MLKELSVLTYKKHRPLLIIITYYGKIIHLNITYEF